MVKIADSITRTATSKEQSILYSGGRRRILKTVLSTAKRVGVMSLLHRHWKKRDMDLSLLTSGSRAMGLRIHFNWGGRGEHMIRRSSSIVFSTTRSNLKDGITGISRMRRILHTTQSIIRKVRELIPLDA